MRKTGFLLVIIFLILSVIYLLLFKPTDEFAENDLYNEIIQRGYIKVGINTDSKPFGFYDDKGNIIGYDAELAGHIAHYIVKNSAAVKFIPVTPSNRLIKASTGEVDIVISTVTITPARLEVVAFSKSYDSAGQALLVRSNSAITSLQDLSGQSIGVIFGTTAEKNIQHLVPTAHVQGYRTYQDAYLALKAGNINAITSDDTILNRFALADKSVKLLPKRYSNEPYGIAFKKGNSTARLKEELDFAIEDLTRRNILNSLHSKWNLG